MPKRNQQPLRKRPLKRASGDSRSVSVSQPIDMLSLLKGIPREREVQHKDGKCTVILPGPINAEPGQYVEAYHEAYNDSGDTSENLIAAIINLFLAGDTAFQAWKKDREKPGAPRTPSARTQTLAVSESATAPPGPSSADMGNK